MSNELILPDETPELRSGVPIHLLKGLREYGLHHRPVGDFLTAVLSNDFMEAIARADVHSLRNIHGIAMFVYNALPDKSWGSPEKVKAWLASIRDS